MMRAGDQDAKHRIDGTDERLNVDKEAFETWATTTDDGSEFMYMLPILKQGAFSGRLTSPQALGVNGTVEGNKITWTFPSTGITCKGILNLSKDRISAGEYFS